MHKSTPQLAIKTLFTPTTLVCFLALSLCTPTSTTALPIQRSSSSSSPQSATAESIDSPFRTVARPITIQVELLNNNEARLIEQTEQLEQHYRQQQPSTIDEQIRLAMLVQEQDQLEREQQDRDQLLDNEEEAQEAQDPEARRRRQEEALGLWMSDAEIEALSQGVNNEDGQEGSACEGSECALEFDLYAEEFQEEQNEEVVTETKGVPTLAPRSLAPEDKNNKNVAPPTEEEMLQWPVVNQALFVEREDENQDEWEDDV
ncbi:hypothetical protein BGZ59_004768 [Podila verticillata]|nr:hypothetical protein BGZ59_004768 [Podila verticillata]